MQTLASIIVVALICGFVIFFVFSLLRRCRLFPDMTEAFLNAPHQVDTLADLGNGERYGMRWSGIRLYYDALGLGEERLKVEIETGPLVELTFAGDELQSALIVGRRPSTPLNPQELRVKDYHTAMGLLRRARELSEQKRHRASIRTS